MKIQHLKGFSLIELIVALSISSIIVGSIFSIFSNINILEKITTKKSNAAIQIAYTYNLLKNDLSNSIPGIVNNKLSVVINSNNELTLHRISMDSNSYNNLKIRKVKWHSKNGKLYRSIFKFGSDKKTNEELIHDFKQEIKFKIEKASNLIISSSKEQLSPAIISVEFGSKYEEIYTFKVGNSL
tara:strand:+ start:1143 stop:1694 length:552 start_codon:yes stop_codon:yes gene_type:complete